MNEPKSSFEIVVAFHPAEVGSNAPIRIATRCWSASADVGLATGATPGSSKPSKYTTVLVDAAEALLFHRSQAKAGRDLRDSSHIIACRKSAAHVQNDRGPKTVYPSTAVVASG